MSRERTKRLVLFTAVLILPAVFVRLELCPLASVCGPTHAGQSAAEAPCHQDPGTPPSNQDAPHAFCCQDINPIETQTAKVSAPLVLDVLAVLHDVPRQHASLAVPVVFFEAPDSHAGDPPLFRSYQTLLI